MSRQLPSWPLVREFLGGRVIALAVMSLLLGLSLFAVELTMAFSVQAFFTALGLAEVSGGPMASWMPSSLSAVMMLLLLVGTLRGLLLWAQTFTAGLSTVEFETLSRRRLVAWAFANRSARLANVTNLFNDKTIGAGCFVSSLMGGVSRMIVIVLLIVSLFKAAPLVTAQALGLLLLLYVPFKYLSRRIATVSARIHVELDSAVERVLRGVKNSLLLHVYGLYRREEYATAVHLDGYLVNYRRYHALTGLKAMLPQVVGIWLVCMITLAAKSAGALAGAALVQYFYLFIRFVQCIGELANLYSYIALTRPRMKVMWEWWLAEREFNNDWPADFETAPPFPTPVGWVLEGLTFAYQGAERPVLDHLDLRIEPGETLVITGESGTGKSTLVAILLGLAKPTGGQVEVVSGDIRLPVAEGRARLLAGLGYVGPESFIIPGTMRDNLLYGANARASDAELREVLELAGCGFIRDLPAGLDHWLTEQGEGLSAGQKQRLALARALLRKPSILVLDEATANLDKTTEETLVETLVGLKGRTTIVAVTHRDALLRIADQHLTLTADR